MGSGVGAAIRLVIDRCMRIRFGARLPCVTLTINVTGSLLLGLLMGLAQFGPLPDGWDMVLGTGLLGGYTTLSTATVETVRLLEERRVLAGLLNGVGMVE